jgi:outer membrane biogenesis lipoprotein LolB
MRPFIFLSALAASFLSGCREKDTLFTTLDLNQDRKLSLSELEAGVADGFFKTYDADKDGVVTTAEWRKLDPAGDPIFMKQRDGNGDGKITRKEALAAIHRRGFCREVLQDSDYNNNGVIDPAEAKVWASDHPEIIERLKIGD